MRRYLAYILALIVAVIVGLAIVQDPGYALFSYHNWTVEMPLWLTVLILIVVFAVLMFILRLFDNTRFLIHRVRYWRRKNRMLKMQQKTERGMLELLEGRFQAAEQHLKKSASSAEAPIVNYLTAAQAANALGAYDRRDVYLSKAKRKEPSAEIAVLIIKAQLQLEKQQFLEAEHTLERLYKMAPKHETVLRLLYELHSKQAQWQKLEKLLPKLKRHKLISIEEEEQLTITIQQQLLQNSTQPKMVWDKLPRHLRKSTKLLLSYIDTLLKQQAFGPAELILSEHLRKNWDDALCQRYGNVISDNPDKQLQLAEKWLKKQPENAALLLALGKICLRLELWGKAKTYLSNSLFIKPEIETYKHLAQLLEQLGETKEALAYYRQALD